jgi:hypothetical protein
MAFQINGTTILDANAGGSSAISNVTSLNATGDAAYFEATPSSPYYGTVAGFVSAGYGAPPSPPPTGYQRVIQRFPFATDTDSTYIGDGLVQGYSVTGNSSTTHGYRQGMGFPASINQPDGTSWSSNQEKFTFSSTTYASSAGSLVNAVMSGMGVSAPDTGYIIGGIAGSPSNGNIRNYIQKFSFRSDANASLNTGALNAGKSNGGGHASTIKGYVSTGSSYSGNPGVSPLGITASIESFPFSTDSNATIVGQVTVGRTNAVGQSSPISGYTSGGYLPSPVTSYTTIDKFPFASNTNSTSVGSLTQARTDGCGAGHSSVNYGYTSGGYMQTRIDKFSFSTDSNATTVGSLAKQTWLAAGHQD